MSPRETLRALFDSAVAAADPARIVPAHLPAAPAGHTVVVGAGKAAAAMARAVEDHWPGPLSGLVVTRYGHGVPCRRIEVVEAGHPLPDGAGRDAAARILALAGALGPDDLLLCLVSGGGSALLVQPALGLALDDKQALTRQLLRSGAAIGEMNCVRKHLSAIKGGRLAAAAFPARTLALVISDVPGDDPATVASGPTVADPTTAAEALAVLDRYRIDVPPAIRRHLEGPDAETPKPGDPRLARSSVRLIATAKDALAAAAAAARAGGFAPTVLGDALEGEAADLARAHARLALAAPRPGVILSGGETTVTVGPAGGRGGRNGEYLLALAVALDGAAGVHALACDTDGIDGSEDNAGAVIGPDTLARAAAAGLDPVAMLRGHDSFGLFAALGDLVVTGPTRTNVNDFRAILLT
ncbi:MAG: glycerate kinase [Rhodospirillales bacterium]